MEQKLEKKSTNFLIRIYFQRNCSWQGEIQWLDNKKGERIYFRSFLELIILLHTAMEASDEIEIKKFLRSWRQSTAEVEQTSSAESRSNSSQTEHHEVGEVND